MDRYFKIAEDLDAIDKETNQYVYVPRDLDKDNIIDHELKDEISDELSTDEINKFLQGVVSGKEYDFECELGTLCSGGSCIVSFEELKEMIDDGSYNIISANCFNKDMIEIRYQQFDKNLSFNMR